MLLPFSHLSQRSNTATPPPHRDAFVLGMHSMSGMGMYDPKKRGDFLHEEEAFQIRVNENRVQGERLIIISPVSGD